MRVHVKRPPLYLVLMLAAAIAAGVAMAAPRPPVYVVGDSIANGCPEWALPFWTVHNRAVSGSRIADALGQLEHVDAGAVWVHTGVNDVRADNPNAERDLRALLAAIAARPELSAVVDEIGPILPAFRTPARNAARERLNAVAREFSAPNVRTAPFAATSLPDGLHPDAAGYAQHMPAVVVLLMRM